MVFAATSNFSSDDIVPVILIDYFEDGEPRNLLDGCNFSLGRGQFVN